MKSVWFTLLTIYFWNRKSYMGITLAIERVSTKNGFLIVGIITKRSFGVPKSLQKDRHSYIIPAKTSQYWGRRMLAGKKTSSVSYKALLE